MLFSCYSFVEDANDQQLLDREDDSAQLALTSTVSTMPDSSFSLFYSENNSLVYGMYCVAILDYLSWLVFVQQLE